MAESSGGYLAPAAASTGELREKGSRFLARLEPVENEAAARSRLAAIERAHADATHCCFAWRLGHPARERCSDAGEPAGTAGPPILRALRGAELSDVLLVVARWFGGVKLGKGGLARAYAGAARTAIEGARLVARVPTARLLVVAPYAAVGAVQRLVHPPAVVLRDARYGAFAELVLDVQVEHLDAIGETLRGLGLAFTRASDDAPGAT